MRNLIGRCIRIARHFCWLLTGRRVGVYNGVAARDVPPWWPLDHEPEYKNVLIGAVHEHVGPGDYVLVVGGERAVDAVHAARAGAASVTVYEAALEAYNVTLETIRLNAVADTVTAEWACVGEVVDAYGDTLSNRLIPPAALPDADVIVLDCEGAERQILPELHTDATVIVETHPENGADTSWVVQQCNGWVAGPDLISGDIVVASGTTAAGGRPERDC